MSGDLWWRNLINGLEIRNDLIGEPEFVTAEEPEESEAQPDVSDKEAAVLRLKLDIYLISPLGESKAYMVTGKSSMEDAGVMTVRDALKLIERRKKR